MPSGSDHCSQTSDTRPQRHDQMSQWVERECRATPELEALRNEVEEELANEDASQEMVILQILETADEHYEQLWKASSEDERFVLSQLASDGLLNPVNTAAIRKLLKRGLLVHEPPFRIMNESFRRFVLTAATPEMRQGWRDESRATGWGKARGVFSTIMILVAVFLLATQNALWQSAAAYVTTAIGGVGTLMKLFHVVRGDKSAVGETAK
jgi:hypothetical protein